MYRLGFSYLFVRNFTGLETFRIETFDLVPSTDTFDIHLLRWNGADWSGTWIFRAGFDEIASTMKGGMFANGCSYAVTDTFGGSSVAANPMIELEFTIAGATPSLF